MEFYWEHPFVVNQVKSKELDSPIPSALPFWVVQVKLDSAGDAGSQATQIITALSSN